MTPEDGMIAFFVFEAIIFIFLIGSFFYFCWRER
jgi:hypothetical protein